MLGVQHSRVSLQAKWANGEDSQARVFSGSSAMGLSVGARETLQKVLGQRSVLGHAIYRKSPPLYPMEVVDIRYPWVPDSLQSGFHFCSLHPPFFSQWSLCFPSLSMEVKEEKNQEFFQVILVLFNCNKVDIHIGFSNILSPGWLTFQCVFIFLFSLILFCSAFAVDTIIFAK